MSFAEIVKEFDVKDYLSQIGKIHRSGATNIVCKPCPMCGDNRGKFYANASGNDFNGKWNSYCCHNEGGLVQLVAAVEECSDIEATGFIVRIVSGEEEKLIPVISPDAPVQADAPWSVILPKPLYRALPEMSCVVDGLPSSLRARGIDEYIIARHHLAATGAGTIFADRHRSEYDNRLFIPVFYQGVLRTWQARDLTGKAERKYVFPAGDCSGSLFYGMDDFIAHGHGTMLIVEGAPGKWSWDTLGRDMRNEAVENMAVASFGKSLSFAQEELLINTPSVKRVIFGWDLDAAPQVSKVAARLNGRKEVFIMLPDEQGRDHDELTAEERLALLMKAVPWSLELSVRMKTQLAMRGNR